MQILTTAKSQSQRNNGVILENFQLNSWVVLIKGHVWKAGTGIFHEF